MRYLLDSHAFVWVKSAPEVLSDEARAAVIDPGNDVLVSTASAWELWIKHARTPIVALAPLLDSGSGAFLRALADSDLGLLDIALDHVAMAARLPRLHRDPFDRLLIAQALTEDLTIVTRDPAFSRYRGVKVLKA